MKKHLCFLILAVLSVSFLFAQDDRTQYRGLLKNSFFSVNFGYINTPYSEAQLEPGYHAGSITDHHFGMRLVLFGHQFNKYLSAQVSYMKPLQYAIYQNINGDGSRNSVWLHSGTLTVKGNLPLTQKLSIYGETGLGIFTRRGFTDNNNVDIVKNSSYGTLVFGTGLQYKLSRKWDALLSFTYGPGKSDDKQPHTVFYNAGFQYNLVSLPDEKVKRNANTPYIFHKNLFQVGYSTNGLGYWPNNYFSKKLPIFWGGGIEVNQGVLVHYQRNVFHTYKVFAFDIGASTGFWQSNEEKQNFYTLSVFPLFRFNVIRTNPFDFYLFYSAAGPSFISKKFIDEKEGGRHFTFEDMMGFGGFIGKQKHLNAEVHINHYSNGNIFPFNRGVKIPLTFNLGYAF